MTALDKRFSLGSMPDDSLQPAEYHLLLPVVLRNPPS